MNHLQLVLKILNREIIRYKQQLLSYDSKEYEELAEIKKEELAELLQAKSYTQARLDEIAKQFHVSI